MGKRSSAEDVTSDNPLEGLKEYLEAHQAESIFERENGSDAELCLFLQKGRRACGRIRGNEKYEFDLHPPEGEAEKTHKVEVKFLCKASDLPELLKQMKVEEKVAAKPEGPHFSPRYRHHIKNKTLYPLMRRREVLFFTTVEGEVLRGIVTGFSRWEVTLGLKRGVPVTLLRHAVREVKDKKGRSFLKKAVEKTGELW